MLRLYVMAAVFLFRCADSNSKNSIASATKTSRSTPVKTVLDTETLKKKLKSQICSFLTETEVAQLLGVTEPMGNVSGYDGTTGHYCSYNWNDFTHEAKFAYVSSTIGKPAQVAESLRMFRKSASLEPATVAVAGIEGAFWNAQSSRLSVFFSDVQLYIDLRKTDRPDKKKTAIKLIEMALQRL